MSNIVPSLSAEIVEKVLIVGDLSKLSSEERLKYYNALCTELGLNPLTKPFEYITLNNKLTLYARKDCTDQLRRIYGISIDLDRGEFFDDVYVVRAKARLGSTRCDESTGAVTIGNLKGDAKANAMMKAETKAKRRATLSICGLGMLDETELETIKDAKPVNQMTVLDAVSAPVVKPPKPVEAPETAGDHVVRIGKKYVGMKLKDIKRQELMSFVDWIHTKADDRFKTHDDTNEFLFYAEQYLTQEVDELDRALSSKFDPGSFD